MKKDKSKPSSNIFEALLKELSLSYNPNSGNLVLSFPALPVLKNNGKIQPILSTNEENPNSEEKRNNTTDLTPVAPGKLEEKEIIDVKIDVKESMDESLSMDDLDSEIDPVRVKIDLNAYLKLALHALKYASPKVPRKNWVEVIGLLVGYIENQDTPLAALVITDAYPIGHGTDINAQIQDPQSLVRVYKAKDKGTQILGWYHSHPSYDCFMSSTDFQTQVRYQRLARDTNEFTAPIALVIDPTRISTRSYGFKIFRLRNNFKQWEEPRFEVLDCPVSSVLGIIKATMPLAEGKKMYLEYDYES